MSAKEEHSPQDVGGNRDGQSEVSRRWAERQLNKRNANPDRRDWTTIVVLILAVVSCFHLISVVACHAPKSAAAERLAPIPLPAIELPSAPSSLR